jgi:hypothetical protein
VLTALKQAWPNAPIDLRDPAQVWAYALERLSGDQIRHGIRQLSVVPSDFPPPPGKFRELCLSFRREEPAAKPTPRIDDGGKTTAWRACCAAYAVRVCGMTPAPQPDTDFDVEYVASSVDLPRDTLSIESNARAWDALKRKFEFEWRARH